MDLEKLKEKVKGLPVEQKNALREVLLEDSPDSFLSKDEIAEFREILKIKKEKAGKKPGIIGFLDSLYE